MDNKWKYFIVLTLFFVSCETIFGAPICANLQTSQDSPSWEWPISTPEKQGLDAKRLAELVHSIREGREYPEFPPERPP